MIFYECTDFKVLWQTSGGGVKGGVRAHVQSYGVQHEGREECHPALEVLLWIVVLPVMLERVDMPLLLEADPLDLSLVAGVEVEVAHEPL